MSASNAAHVAAITSTLARDLTGERPDELRGILDELDNHLIALQEQGDLSHAEQTMLDSGIGVRSGILDRLETHDQLREIFNLRPHAVEMANGRHDIGNGSRFGEARSVIDAANRQGGLPDHAAEIATRLVEQGTLTDRSLAARWAVSAGDPHYLTCFAKLASDPERGHLLWTEQEQAAFRAVREVQDELRAMSLTGAAGGFMVPIQLDPALMLTSAGSNNPLRRISRVVQTVGSQWQGVTTAGVTAEWKAEAAEVADASPTLASPNIPVHFGDAFIPYSFEIGLDAVRFVEELQTVLVDAADQLQATAYTTGTGTGQPKGIITAIVGTASIVVGTEAFPNSQVYDVQNALPPRFSGNAQWCANIAIINLLSQKETTAGARLFPELAEGRLLNKPMNELSNMDGTITGAAENYILLYGDFRNMIIVDRIGTSIEFIPQLFHLTTNRPSGQRGALMWFRTGSDAPVFNAFRLLNAT